MTCTHSLPPGCCKLCAAERKQEQTPQEHVDGELITRIKRIEFGWRCQVFAIGDRLLDEYDAIGLDYDAAIDFAEYMAQCIKDGTTWRPEPIVTATYTGPANLAEFFRWAEEESADWADWRESQRPQPESAADCRLREAQDENINGSDWRVRNQPPPAVQ